jgi:ABC-type nitrate/sulfonate/bicarbonate transport system substrate-binding protein
VDVRILSEPWITRAQTIGAGEVWILLSDITPTLSRGTIFIGPSLLENNPEVGIRFMTAYLKAVKQFNQSKTDRNIGIIANYTKLSPEDIRAACWTSFKDDGTIDTETKLEFQKWSLEKGYGDGTLGLDQFWTPQFVDEAEKRLASVK